jgi:hypothetical protein
VRDTTEPLTIAEFEHVAAGPSATLLRVRATMPTVSGAPDRRPELLAEHGAGLERFAALPSPPDPPGVMRAAYSVPLALITLETTFTLALSDGTSVHLPAPTVGAARRAATPDDAGPDDVGPAPADAATLSARLAELEVWTGELERRLTDATDELADARARLAAAELDALSVRAETEALQQAARELAAARSGG